MKFVRFGLLQVYICTTQRVEIQENQFNDVEPTFLPQHNLPNLQCLTLPWLLLCMSNRAPSFLVSQAQAQVQHRYEGFSSRNPTLELHFCENSTKFQSQTDLSLAQQATPAAALCQPSQTSQKNPTTISPSTASSHKPDPLPATPRSNWPPCPMSPSLRRTGQTSPATGSARMRSPKSSSPPTMNRRLSPRNPTSTSLR